MADVRPATSDSIRLSELTAAWSVAINVGMVMPMEFGLRVCSRAVRLAQRMDLDDERTFRAGLGTRDVSDGGALLPYLVQLTVASRPLAQRPVALIHLLARAGVMKQAGAAVCEVARMLLDRLGFDAGLGERLRDDGLWSVSAPTGRAS